LTVYAVWVAATYLLEALPGTLARPEASGLRLAYALVANLGIGILLPLWLIRRELRNGSGSAADYGFSGALRTSLGIAAAAVAGYALFRFSQPQPVDPMLLLNTFAQVWVVSAAEIMVCWALAGATLRMALRRWHRAAAVLVAAAVSSVLFGIYHFAHSPPFNELGMVAFLTGIGFLTSLWWFISRDVYGTAVFHSFFGVTGVLAALRATGDLPDRPQPAIALIITAVVVTGAMAWPALRERQGG
jgi:hypothetical protein